MRINKYMMLLQEEAGNGEGGQGDGSSGGSNGSDNSGDGALLAGKYENQEALIQGYTELNTAFSAKDETHKGEMDALKSPEEFTAGEGWGSDNAMDNRMMSVFSEVAKEHNMSQGMYESLVDGMVEMHSRVETESLAEVQKSIPNYDNRANAMIDTALRFLRPDQAKGLDALMTSKESFEAVELMMAQVRGSGLPPITNGGGDQMNDRDLRDAIRKLNPADTSERKRLTDILNSRGDGEGKLIQAVAQRPTMCVCGKICYNCPIVWGNLNCPQTQKLNKET